MCVIPGCDRDDIARGLCTKHYQYYTSHGELHNFVTTRDGAALRWLERYTACRQTACLIWPFNRHCKGYGVVSYQRKPQGAHRIMCILAHGPPPTPKHQAAHSCGNGHLGCVNPRHLRWATQKENSADAKIHGTLYISAGELNGNSKLTNDEVRKVKELLSTKTIYDIAHTFGVHPSTIDFIKKGKTWKSVQI